MVEQSKFIPEFIISNSIGCRHRDDIGGASARGDDDDGRPVDGRAGGRATQRRAGQERTAAVPGVHEAAQARHAGPGGHGGRSCARRRAPAAPSGAPSHDRGAEFARGPALSASYRETTTVQVVVCRVASRRVADADAVQ